MAFPYTTEIVVSAMNACFDVRGNWSNLNKAATEFLEKYQESSSSWKISDGMLWDMDEREDLLVLAVVTLRYRIRNHLHELTDKEQSDIFNRFVTYVRCATTNHMQHLLLHLSVAIADLVLRWRLDEPILKLVVNNFFVEMPAALFQLLKVLPVEAILLDEKQRLEGESIAFLRYLTWVQNRTDLDYICLNRACLLICASWTRSHFLSLEQLATNNVMEMAFHLMLNPTLFEGELNMEASECIVALLEHVSHLKENQAIDLGLELQIFHYCSSISFPTSHDDKKLIKATAQIYIQMTETYACLNVRHPPSVPLEQGPFCFELLLNVANHCDQSTIISSMPLWHKLFDQLPFRFEPERCILYHSIVTRALDAFFRQCRLPSERLARNSAAFDALMELRNHVKDLLPNISELGETVTLESFTDQLVLAAFGTNGHWADIETSLLFLIPLIPKIALKHPELIVEMVENLPNYILDSNLHPTVCQQIIALNTECHKYYDNHFQRHKFVSQLLGFSAHLGNAPTDRDTLEVIIQSCNVLYNCRANDLSSYEPELRSLVETLEKMPTDPETDPST